MPVRIQRKEYLDKLISFKDKRLIKVITGIRRSGKSTLLEIFRDHLKENGVDENRIIEINFENFDYYELRDPFRLHDHIKDRLTDGKMNYVFLDEVQHVENWQEAVNSLMLRENVDLYITGSNAHMLSGELATYISGRYVEIKILPLSFKEFADGLMLYERLSEKSRSSVSAGLHDLNDRSLSGLYRKYIEMSSFPYILELKDQPEAIRDYLEAVYNTIVVKDIAVRHKITDTMMLESITRYLFDNIGNPVSCKKIADTMSSSGRKIDVKTVEKYVRSLTESFVFYPSKRYDIKGKQYLKTSGKFYAADVGMRRMLLGSRSVDSGRILENIVYLELLRRGYTVYTGKINSLEVDFIAENEEGLIYIQTSATVRDEETLKRELEPLKKITDHYQKLILTLDDDPEADHDGIRRINVLDWLTGRV